MATQPILTAPVSRVLLSVETMGRLDVLLHLYALRGKAVTAKAIAGVFRTSVAAAERHLAKLCACGLLAVTIGTELHYSYRPIEQSARAAVDELDRLVVTQREELAVWLRGHVRRHAFIAEDDTEMRETLRSFMEAWGFRATALPHGREALARADAEEIAIALVGVRASSSHGLTLVRTLRERADPVSTIVMTSFGDAHLQSRIASLGVRSVLEKPFELEAFANVIEALG